MKTINHPLFGRGRLVTEPTVTVAASASLAELIKGDGSRVALILAAFFAATIDPETIVQVNQEGQGAGVALVTLTPTWPFVVLRYQDLGPVVGQRLMYVATAATITLSVTPVRWEPEGSY